MLLTVAYVKNESTTNGLDFRTSNSEGNEGIDEQHLIAMADVKTERTEAYPDSTSGDVTDEEHDMMHMKQESEDYHFTGHAIRHMTDTSQLDRICESDAKDMDTICPSSATQSTAKAHTHISKIVYSRGKRFNCDVYAYRNRQIIGYE